MDNAKGVELFVCDIPNDLGLYYLSIEITNKIDSFDNLLSIKVATDENGKLIKGLAIIVVKLESDASVLMRKPLTLRHCGKTYELSVTRSKETATSWVGVDTTFTDDTASHDLMNQKKKQSVNEMKFIIASGDISLNKADVIVTSTTPQNFASCQGSTISRALLELAGKRLQEACQSANRPDLRPGNVLCTPGFDLSCKKVFHVILQDYKSKESETELECAIKLCLWMADVAGYSSIAFPLLGSGGFGYPLDIVLRIFMDAMKSFTGKKLQQKELLVFPDSGNMLQTVQDFLLAEATRNSKTLDINRINVVVQQGDITTTCSDVIVNSTKQFNFSSQISQALIAKGGKSLIGEFANPIIQTNNIRVTTGGTLWKYIFHLATPSDPGLLINVLLECFSMAQKFEVRSLALPSIGTGGIGLSFEQSAKCVTEAVRQFKGNCSSSLKRIEIYVLLAKNMQIYQKAIATPSDENQDIPSITTTKTTTSEPETPLGPKSDDKIISSQNTDKDHTMLVVKTIRDTAIKHSICVDDPEMVDLMKSGNVLIEKSSECELSIKGYPLDVLEAYTHVASLLSTLNEQIKLSKSIVWKYTDPKTNATNGFSVAANFSMETAYRNNENGNTKLVTLIRQKRVTVLADFRKMEAYFGGSVFLLQRNEIIMQQMPTSWGDMEGETLKKVSLSENSFEYQNVLRKFTTTLDFIPIKLERIQNQTLWNQFQAQKQKVQAKMPNQQITCELFHGTHENVCEKILKDGFDRSHAGRNGTRYGKGVYFSSTAKYSHQFTIPAPSQGQRCMFLASVVTGSYCQGTTSTHVAPIQEDGSLFDSVVDDPSDPNIYVVFRDASVYPSYLLSYTDVFSSTSL